MTANNGPDSDLISLLGMVFAAGWAQPLIAAAPSCTGLSRATAGLKQEGSRAFGVRGSYRPV